MTALSKIQMQGSSQVGQALSSGSSRHERRLPPKMAAPPDRGHFHGSRVGHRPMETPGGRGTIALSPSITIVATRQFGRCPSKLPGLQRFAALMICCEQMRRRRLKPTLQTEVRATRLIRDKPCRVLGTASALDGQFDAVAGAQGDAGLQLDLLILDKA
jgi:hypothetical protein